MNASSTYTPWFLARVTPARRGLYETQKALDGGGRLPVVKLFWNGVVWMRNTDGGWVVADFGLHEQDRWRGATAPEAAREVSAV